MRNYMSKISVCVILIGFFVLVSNVYAQQPTPKPKLKTPKEWERPIIKPRAEGYEDIEITPGMIMTRGKTSKTIIRIRGNVVIDGAKSEEEAARAYLKQIHDIFGLPEDLNTLKLANVDHDSKHKIYTFQQFFKGIPIFGAMIDVYISNGNIVNEVLRP